MRYWTRAGVHIPEKFVDVGGRGVGFVLVKGPFGWRFIAFRAAPTRGIRRTEFVLVSTVVALCDLYMGNVAMQMNILWPQVAGL